MNVSEMLDDIEQVIAADGYAAKNRWLLLAWMSAELSELSGKADWDWNLAYLDPAVMTITGVSHYMLPANFGSNFSRYASDDGGDYACKLDDNSSQGILKYESPKQFFSHDFTSVSNGRPSSYSVMSTDSGRKEIWIYPPPDANGSVGYYLISGLYPQTDWHLDEMGGLPAIPGNSAVLKYGVLRRLNRTIYGPLYEEALSRLLVSEAQNKRAQLVPASNQEGMRTHYDVYGGRSV